MLKFLFGTALLSVVVMLLSRLFGSAGAVRPVDLDGLATLELPASFHLDDSPQEQQLPPARRRRRQPYLHPPVSADQLTYYLLSHYSYGFGGQKVPVLLRVTLYADDVPLAEAPDQAYFQALIEQNYRHDGQQDATYAARAAPVGDGLYFTAEPATSPGWLSMNAYHELHLILTDPAQHVRLFLSADDRELSRRTAEKLLRQAMQRLRREPATLAQHFEYLRQFRQHETAIKEANVQANLRHFNAQLAAANLPALRPVALYGQARFVDVGNYFYGVSTEQEVQFMARLGTSTAAEPASISEGHYLPSFNQQAILQQGTPAGQEVRLHTGVSEPLWFPPEEFAGFQLADLLRENQASQTQAHQAPAYWDLSQVGSSDNQATLSQPADYRHAGATFGARTGTSFTLHYLGTRTAAGQPPQLVFTLETFDGSPRYHRMAANAQYLAVNADKGGQLDLTVAGARYRIRIEPPAQGQLRVESLE